MAENEIVRDLTEEDIGAGASFEGDTVKMEELVGENVIILDFGTRKSDYSEGDYAIVQINLDGEKRVVLTGASVIMDNLNTYKDLMPYRCKVGEFTSSKSHFKYYALTPPS